MTLEVCVPGRGIQVTVGRDLAHTALIPPVRCIAGLYGQDACFWCTCWARDFESGSSPTRLIYEGEKVVYEAEDFHRVVACTGSVVSLCKAADGYGPCASTVIP
jgi:hypothetical protein